jgi:hypothetical protein
MFDTGFYGLPEKILDARLFVCRQGSATESLRVGNRGSEMDPADCLENEVQSVRLNNNLTLRPVLLTETPYQKTFCTKTRKFTYDKRLLKRKTIERHH